MDSDKSIKIAERNFRTTVTSTMFLSDSLGVGKWVCIFLLVPVVLLLKTAGLVPGLILVGGAVFCTKKRKSVLRSFENTFGTSLEELSTEVKKGKSLDLRTVERLAEKNKLDSLTKD